MVIDKNLKEKERKTLFSTRNELILLRVCILLLLILIIILMFYAHNIQTGALNLCPTTEVNNYAQNLSFNWNVS